MIAANSVTDADAMFLDQVVQMFAYQNLPFEVLDGTRDEINAVINKFSGTAALRQDRITGYAGPLRQPVREKLQTYCAKQAAAPMTLMDRLYAVMGMNRQVRYAKLYAQYFVSG